MIDINLKPLFEFTKNVCLNMNRSQYTKHDLRILHNHIKLMEVEANYLTLKFRLLIAEQGMTCFAEQRTPINTKP